VQLVPNLPAVGHQKNPVEPEQKTACRAEWRDAKHRAAMPLTSPSPIGHASVSWCSTRWPCFIGKRRAAPSNVDDTHSWQMPQGGVDPGEEPWPAATA